MKRVKYSMQRGFAMLEVLLAIVIIAIVGLAVVELYGKASSSASIESEERIVNNVISAWQQYASTYYELPTLESLISNKLLPDSLASDGAGGADGVINAPWGTITVATPDDTSYQQVSLTVAGVPGGVAKQFCSDMFKSYDVNNGTTLVVAPADCDSDTYAATNVFVIASPKGSLTTS